MEYFLPPVEVTPENESESGGEVIEPVIALGGGNPRESKRCDVCKNFINKLRLHTASMLTVYLILIRM